MPTVCVISGWSLVPTSFARTSRHPHRFAMFGRQHDTGRPLYNVIINSSRHGDVPGKGQEFSKAWYSFGGREFMEKNMTNVKWLTSSTDEPLTLRRNNGSGAPANAIPCGHQRDSGTYYAAIAQCSHGLVPGKAKGNACWYPWGGKEHTTSDYSWVVVSPSIRAGGLQCQTTANADQPGAAGKCYDLLRTFLTLFSVNLKNSIIRLHTVSMMTL